jgi:hypothetical protein
MDRLGGILRALGARRLLALVILLGGCDQLLDSGGRSDRVAKLEARVTALETQLRDRHSDKPPEDHAMADCLSLATDAYWNHIKSNGRQKGKPDEDGNATWAAPSPIWDQAAKIKQNAIEECRVRYGRQ